MQKKSMHILLSLLKANNFKYYKWSVHFEPTIFYCYNITKQEQKNNADKQRYFFQTVDKLSGTCNILFLYFKV